MNLINRPRRLRNGALLRSMVRETRISADTLIYPMFVQDGENIREEIPSMPGQYRWSLDRVDELLQQVTDSGVKSVLLFGIPAEKDEIGSSAWQPDGIVQRAVRHIKAAFPQLYVITDVCMCEYTSHGHCGILCGHDVDNDKTLEVLAKTALSHVQAGADMVAPSDMMDGRVARIRQVLDENGYVNTPIMSYSVKYASAFYGPFRGWVLLQQFGHYLLHPALCRLLHLHQVRVQAPVQEHRVVQHRAMVHQVRPAHPAVLAQRDLRLAEGQVRELVIPDGRVGHVPVLHIHAGSFLHCGDGWWF